MPLSDLSFKLYTDAALTIPFSGLLQLIHQSSLSDNPQIIGPLYFGSTNSLNQLQANSDPGVDQITLSVVDLLAEWEPSHVYTTGILRQPTTPNGFKYRVTSAGTSSASEPTWPVVGIGSTVSDGSVTWTFVGAHHPTTEITLGLTEADLATNTPGAPLDLGVTILGGVANAVEIWLKKVNTVTTPGDNTGFPEHGVDINSVIETVI